MKTLQKTLQGAAIVAAFIASASIAKADLSLNGAVGLPLNPTAEIPAKNSPVVQGNYYDLGGEGDSVKQYGLYAAGQVADGFELSGGYEHLKLNSLKLDGFALGGKYLFTHKSAPSAVQFAAGVGYSSTDAKNLYIYGVASKTFGESADRAPIRGHLGLRYDRFDYGRLLTNDKSSKVSVYAGVEVPFTRTGDLSFVGELQSKVTEFKGLKEPYSAGIRYAPQSSDFSAAIGIQRRPFIFSNKSNLYLQLGYSFGGDKSDTTETSPVQ